MELGVHIVSFFSILIPTVYCNLISIFLWYCCRYFWCITRMFFIYSGWEKSFKSCFYFSQPYLILEQSGFHGSDWLFVLNILINCKNQYNKTKLSNNNILMPDSTWKLHRAKFLLWKMWVFYIITLFPILSCYICTFERISCLSVGQAIYQFRLSDIWFLLIFTCPGQADRP